MLQCYITMKQKGLMKQYEEILKDSQKIFAHTDLERISQVSSVQQAVSERDQKWRILRTQIRDQYTLSASSFEWGNSREKEYHDKECHRGKKRDQWTDIPFYFFACLDRVSFNHT